MTDKPGNNTDAWLEDESTVSRAYGELQQPGPPPQLDEKILAEARRAVEQQDNVVIRVQHWRKWTMPAALAATVVFAVPLVVRVFDTMSSDFETSRGPAMTMTEQATMETPMAESGQDFSAPTQAMPATVTTDGQVSGRQTVPPVITPLPARSLLPLLERTDQETLPADEPRRQARKAEPAATTIDLPAADSGKSGRAPALADTADLAESEVFAAAPPGREAGQAESLMDDPGDTGAAIARKMAPDSGFEAREAARDAGYRGKDARSETQQAAALAQDDAHYRATQPGAAAASVDMAAASEENRLGSAGLREPQQWLSDIADQHSQGLVRTARRALGRFLTTYPDYALPDDYPLQAEDALYDDGTAGGTPDNTGDIVPEAAAWLRGIGMMAERGDIDQARTQLAAFLKIYPDYPLPQNFPLTREDALPIQR